jgi:hypothetical protein
MHNLPIKEVAALGKELAFSISQIKWHIEDSGSLGYAFQWAIEVQKYIR